MIKNGRLIGPNWLYEIKEHTSEKGNVSGWYAVATNPEKLKEDLRSKLIEELAREDKYKELHDRFSALSPDAQQVYQEGP